MVLESIVETKSENLVIKESFNLRLFRKNRADLAPSEEGTLIPP